MRNVLALFILITSVLVSGCFESKPSNLAVEVMAKRYWMDALQMQTMFPIEEVQLLSAHKEGADVYIAQVRYRVRAQFGEAELVTALQQADQRGEKSLADRAEVMTALSQARTDFRAQDSVEFIKRLQFANGSKGWLLTRELPMQ